MHASFVIPRVGDGVTADDVSRLAREAEDAGFTTLWVIEAERFPAPQDTDEGAHQALIQATAATSRITIGFVPVNLPLHSPVALASRLTAIDHQSGGRIRLGFGLGQTATEARYVSAALTEPTPTREFTQAFEAVWRGGNVDFSGEYFSIFASASNDSAAVGRVMPPISLVAFAPPAVRPSVELFAAPSQNRPLSPLHQSLSVVREGQATVAASHDYSGLVARVSVGQMRGLDHSDVASIHADLATYGDLGATEVMFDLTVPTARQSTQYFIDGIRELRNLTTPAASRAETLVAVA